MTSNVKKCKEMNLQSGRRHLTILCLHPVKIVVSLLQQQSNACESRFVTPIERKGMHYWYVLLADIITSSYILQARPVNTALCLFYILPHLWESEYLHLRTCMSISYSCMGTSLPPQLTYSEEWLGFILPGCIPPCSKACSNFFKSYLIFLIPKGSLL